MTFFRVFGVKSLQKHPLTPHDFDLFLRNSLHWRHFLRRTRISKKFCADGTLTASFLPKIADQFGENRTCGRFFAPKSALFAVLRSKKCWNRLNSPLCTQNTGSRVPEPIFKNPLLGVILVVQAKSTQKRREKKCSAASERYFPGRTRPGTTFFGISDHNCML